MLGVDHEVRIVAGGRVASAGSWRDGEPLRLVGGGTAVYLLRLVPTHGPNVQQVAIP